MSHNSSRTVYKSEIRLPLRFRNVPMPQKQPQSDKFSVTTIFLRRLNLDWIWRMTSSGTLHRVALVRTNVSEERSASIIMMTLIMGAISSSETSVLTRAIRRNIPEDVILHSHRRENLRSYKDWISLRHSFKTSLYILNIYRTPIQSQSQIYLTTDGQSASLPLYQATIMEQRQSFFSFTEIILRYLRFFYYGSPSLTGRRVCNLFVSNGTGPCQRCYSREQFQHNLTPYHTFSFEIGFPSCGPLRLAGLL
jgi:hypothetical protein